MRFVLHELHDSAAHMQAIDRTDVTQDLIDSILEEAAKFAQDILLPINASGDEEGCRYENGVVRTPKGFKDAYTRFCENGWSALPRRRNSAVRNCPRCSARWSRKCNAPPI